MIIDLYGTKVNVLNIVEVKYKKARNLKLFMGMKRVSELRFQKKFFGFLNYFHPPEKLKHSEFRCWVPAHVRVITNNDWFDFEFKSNNEALRKQKEIVDKINNALRKYENEIKKKLL